MLKADLISRGEASNLFGLERGDALAALLGNLNQSVFGEPAYPTIERKAAHLLYFVIKNHPLADGNKRTGDTVVVHSMDRLARNLDDLRRIVQILTQRGVHIWRTKNNTRP